MNINDFYWLFDANPGDVTPFSETSNYLMPYLADMSKGPNYKFDLALSLLKNREDLTEENQLKYLPHESKVLQRIFKTISGSNTSYRLAMKQNPTALELEEFSYSAHYYSTLYPIKKYLTHHSDIAQEYFGFLPFGSAVNKFFNKLAEDEYIPKEFKIKGGTNRKHHCILQNITNNVAKLWGMTTVAVNDQMCKIGNTLP